MKLVNQVLAQRKAQKLKSARNLTDAALKQLQDDLVALGEAAVTPLTECLSHGEARAPAMQALDGLLDDSTFETYLDILSSPNPAVVSGVARVMAGNRRYDATRLLKALPDPSVPKSVLEQILQDQMASIPTDKLLFIVPDVGREAQVVIFRLLEKSTDPHLVPRLLPMVKHPDPWVRLSGTKLLSRFADAAAVAGIRGLLDDKSNGVRLEAVHALRKMRAVEAVPALVGVLRDADLKVQSAAIDALCAIADVSAVPHLLAVLTDESDYVRRGAVEVLNVVATPEAIQDLVRALGDQDWWVRVRAADALGALGGEKVVQAVIGLMSAEEDFTRRHAVEILNSMPSQAAVEALIRGLEDADWWVRERSIDALGKTRDPRAVEALLDHMARDEGAIPLCAKALGVSGDPRALEPLALLLESDRDDVRNAAWEGLKGFPQENLPTDRKEFIRRTLSKAQSQGMAEISASLRSHSSSSHSTLAPPAGERGSTPSSPMWSPHPGSSGSLRPGSSTGIRRPTSPSGFRRPGSPVPAPIAARPGAPRPATPERAPVESMVLNYGDLPPGSVLLNRFRVVHKIGKGGFGAVYLVEDAAVRDQMILKILNPQLSFDETVLQRFVRELKLTRKITHRNVIRIHDFFDLGGARAVSMEYFPGRDLGEVLEASGPVELERGLRILTQVCAGLAAAHAEGVIHRDIKPGNVLVDRNDVAKIVDFGLASAQQFAGSRLTKSGLLIGTPEYMAPEQINGESVDLRADIYSVGILMYEMFSGTKPYMADTPVKVLFQHLEGDAEPLGNRVKDLPPSIEGLVHCAMARDPNDRPASADTLRAMIEKELEALGEAA